MSIVQFDHISKQFTLQRNRPRSFQELFLNILRGERTPSREKYMALHDVSFEMEKGEVLGIIGPNGAGKSTVLKLISRIIEPTSGQITINGQVGALLELGTGFHPDLTGRENVYLNGSILGFSRAKMDRILGPIIDFSEMGRFIDVPVKHYSSGMYMRLGFSIAIHVRPDILLVDEVLAVGDQAFQLRCLDKISELKRQGITIVLVSHNLGQVREMCNRAIWLADGQIQAQGDVGSVLDRYVERVIARDEEQMVAAERQRVETADAEAREDEEQGERPEVPWRWGSHEVEIVSVQLLDNTGREQRSFQTGDTLRVRIHYLAHQPVHDPKFGLALYHSSGFHISGPNNVVGGCPVPHIEGPGFLDYVIEELPLLPGTYLLTAAIHDLAGEHTYDHIHQRFTFRVRSGGVRETFGSFYIPSSWHWKPGPSGEEKA
jgi:ABC-type polysaccharide/polyol phosphate transport system ATPase subunit